ncbi:hypothetical protein ABK040_007214 [Willaertia magna]
MPASLKFVIYEDEESLIDISSLRISDNKKITSFPSSTKQQTKINSSKTMNSIIIDTNSQTSLLNYKDNKENIDPLTGMLYPVITNRKKNNANRIPLQDITHLYKRSSSTPEAPTLKDSKLKKKVTSSQTNTPLSPSALYLR